MIELNVLSGDVVDLNVNDNSPTALEVNMATSGGGGGQLSDDVKQALLQIAENVAYINDQGQVYYDDLYNALYPLVSIQAVYTQSGTVYDTDSLDSLKSDLVVTAVHSGGTTETVTAYTLSGSLVEGTSTITVSYGGKTTTFNVTVTHAQVIVLESISAVYTQSGTVYDTDSLDSLKADLVVTATYSDSSTETISSTDYTLSGTLTVGTSTITVVFGGKTDTFTVTVTEFVRYEFKYSDGTLNVGAFSTGWDTTHSIFFTKTSQQAGRRKSGYLDDGDYPVNQYNGSNYSVTDPPEYPIPIPSDATSVTYSITPNTQYIGISTYTYSNNKYVRADDPGWKQGGDTFTFTAGSISYLTVTSKYDAAGTSYPTPPTEVVIKFTTP